MCCSLLWVWAADKANRNKRQTAVAVCLLFRSDIQHRLSGAHEARRRFARTGGVFFAEPQRAGFAAPRGGGKRVDTCGFYPLNSRFPLFLSPAKIGERRLLRNQGNGRGFFLCYGRTTFGVRPLEQPVRSVRYRSATHIGGSPQAQHTRVAQHVSLEITDGTCEFMRLIQFIFVETVCNNALTNCATLLCRACGDFPTCVAVRCL